jgi:hypothetical protein
LWWRSMRESKTSKLISMSTMRTSRITSSKNKGRNRLAKRREAWAWAAQQPILQHSPARPNNAKSINLEECQRGWWRRNCRRTTTSNHVPTSAQRRQRYSTKSTRYKR